MKKLTILIVSGMFILALSNCGPTKTATAPPPPKMTYEANLQTVISNNCTPCHFPARGGNKKPYDNYTNVMKDIDEMIRRIQLNPGDRGFMPFKRAKLSDSTINVFRQWKTDGLLEK